MDTSAFFAVADLKQANYRPATEIQARLRRERWQVVTSNFILAETHALALRRLGRQEALRLLTQLDASADTGSLNVVRVSFEDEVRAREIIRRYNDKDFSLVDASSFAVMERLEIPSAFTFDRHFEQYGLAVLTP